VPLDIERERIVKYRTASGHFTRVARDARAAHQCHIEVALINNMPDSALEDTERQFFQLLSAASGEVPVRVSLYSLPGIPRGERTQQHMAASYFGIRELWSRSFDALIVTGTEPHQSNLKQEPYWGTLVDILDWAQHNTTSTVLSCLAAHAGVLHSDGIGRHLMPEKKLGVFEVDRTDHPLIANLPNQIRVPHSRWNEVKEEAIIGCGYSILGRSKEAGVDSFAKKRGRCLFVHFQGHPEYNTETLLREYRRDVKRYLRSERETYPGMPRGYFSAGAAALFAEFETRALKNRREELMEQFPDVSVIGSLGNTWSGAAGLIYRNWFNYVASKKNDKSARAAAVGMRRAAL
jgi:homoserine O-succinyltransferase